MRQLAAPLQCGSVVGRTGAASLTYPFEVQMTAWAQYLRAVQDLDRLATDMTENEIAQAGVDIAQSATSSRMAYLHFLNDDQNTIELGVWSRDTRATCQAVHDRHYPVAAAGIWADSARTLKPCVHNSYEDVAHKRGLPEGHSRLVRHLGLPVVEGDKVRLLVGVGNKETVYEDDDIEVLDLIARRVWSVLRQRRLLERHLDLGQRFRHLQEFAAVCGLEYDPDEDRLQFDNMFAAIFHTGHPTETPETLHQFLAFVAPADHEAIREALSGEAAVRKVVRFSALRGSGDRFPADLKIEFRRRGLGEGVVGIGILQDVSEQVAVEDLRRRADTDPLTGLPNRRHLDALFKHGIGRRGTDDGIAFHYLDLDAFKPVNDTFGHAVGDEVLRVVAQRLLQVVRKDDLVVRLGGDEFAVVQEGIENEAAAETLAEKIIQSISEPMVALGHPIRIGASIGVALCEASDCRMREVSAVADRALYEAKAAGGNRFVVTHIDAD